MDNHTKELTEGMRRLCAVANRIVAADGKVGRLDLDLLMDDLRRLYDVALRMAEGEKGVDAEPAPLPDEEMLHSTVMATMAAMGAAPAVVHEPAVAEPVAEPAPADEPAVADAPAEPTLEAPEPVIDEPASPKPVSMSDYERESGLLFDEIIIEPEPAPKPEPAVEPAPVVEPEPEPKPEPVVEAEPEAAPVAGEPRQASLLDYLKGPSASQPTVRTIGESTSASHPSVGDRIAAKVDDLRTVININDKFSFMSELFKNNMRAYNDFIMHLNSLTDRAEAVAHVEEVAQQYKWDESSAAVQSFWKIFDKKF